MKTPNTISLSDKLFIMKYDTQLNIVIISSLPITKIEKRDGYIWVTAEGKKTGVFEPRISRCARHIFNGEAQYDMYFLENTNYCLAPFNEICFLNYSQTCEMFFRLQEHMIKIENSIINDSQARIKKISGK